MKPYLVPFALALALTQVNGIADDLPALTTAARTLSSQMAQQLGAELKKELSTNGPVSAISICKSIAPELAGRFSREHGVKISRVSLKTRNPMIGQPDAWEQAVLLDFARRADAGEKPETLEHSEVVAEPQGRYFRYMKAIPVQPLCLSCHGTSETVNKEVEAILGKEYPHDQARGYTLGQLRGAFTVKQRLEAQ